MSTLALNMIIGPNEASLLKRCLISFDARNSFDEIVIVNTSGDNEVTKTAKEFTDKVFSFQWITEEFPLGNFGGAREFAASKTISDKIWWLDTDDVLLDQYKDKFSASLSLIRDDKNKDILLWTIPYVIIVDKNGSPKTLFMRERVFDRKVIHWKRSVHETMFPDLNLVKNASINNMYITHLPIKDSRNSAIRNIPMLEWELKKDPDDIQTKYFLARDCMYCDRSDEAIILFEEILSNLSSSHEMLYAIASELMFFFAYGCMNIHPRIEQLNKDNLLKIEGYCRLAISFSDKFADPYVILGDIYYLKGFVDNAIKMYQTAMKKKIGSGKFQNITFYQDVPAERLSDMFRIRGNLGFSYYYNDLLKDKIINFAERKSLIIEEMYKTCQA